MNIPLKKLPNGFAMPEYGLGTWQMGGRDERDPANDDQADIQGIKDAIDAGITHIDTAEIYANGYTETLVSRAIKGYDRSKLFIVSKVQAAHMSYDGIIEACQHSLERLGLSYLDMYLLHRYNATFPLQESIRAMDELANRGLIRAIGVANFGAGHIAEAQSYTKNKIVCDQVHYNLQFREPKNSGLLEYCRKNDIMLVAWRPVGKGDLLGDQPPVILELCEKYHKTPAQIALNWLISQPNVVTLSKTRSKKHLMENLGAIRWHMDPVDIEKIMTDYPGAQNISNVIPLDK
ncbi:MAG: aldo/keto reductase [Patescibacteria group bacterium]